MYFRTIDTECPKIDGKNNSLCCGKSKCDRNFKKKNILKEVN